MSIAHSGHEQHEIDGAVFRQILGVARRLASSSDLDEVLGLIIDACRDTLGAERASVFQYDPEHHELFATRAHGLSTDLRLNADLGIIGEAARTRRIVNIPDAYADERFNPAVDRKTGFRTRCLLSIPLIDHEDRLVGVVQVLNKGASGGVFDERDEMIARYLADQAAVALKRAALLEAERVKNKLEADLSIARMIQQSALPTALPELAGYDIAGCSLPAEETGGDAFDIVDLVEGCGGDRPGALILMADATGHGIGPALSVTQLLSMFRMGCRLQVDSDEIAAQANRQLCQDLPPGRFVTAFIGHLDVEQHRLFYTSAGQAPLVMLRSSETTEEGEQILPANAMPFGIDEDFECDDVEPFFFDPGDVFLLLSDGYYEAQNAAGDQLGIQGVVRIVKSVMDRPAEQILQALREGVIQHAGGRPPDDDQTAIVIKRTREGTS